MRELRNAVEHAVLMADGTTIGADELGLPEITIFDAATAPVAAAPGEAPLDLPSLERATVVQALERTDWNVTQAARLLGISRDTLRYRIEKHRLARPERRA